MKTKLYEILSEVLFWVALRVSRVSTWLYRMAGRCWDRSPAGAKGRWLDQAKEAFVARTEPGLPEPAPEPLHLQPKSSDTVPVRGYVRRKRKKQPKR